jgi:hypothetical protein
LDHTTRAADEKQGIPLFIADEIGEAARDMGGSPDSQSESQIKVTLETRCSWLCNMAVLVSKARKVLGEKPFL